jgi:hypothetical protein
MQQQRPDGSSNPMVPYATKPGCSENVERLRYIEHRGKRILLADVSACTQEQLQECIKAVPQYVTKLPDHSVLLLGDFTGTHFSKDTVEQLKIAAVFDRPHVAKAAWVLSDNLHKVLMESIRTFSAREIAVFTTREEALDYLAS